MSIQMLMGSIVFFVASTLAGELTSFRLANVSAASAVGWVYLVTFGAIVGFTAYVYLLHNVPPAMVSTHAYVNPVVAVFLGWAIAGESIPTRVLVAAAVILGGVPIVTLAQPEDSGSP